MDWEDRLDDWELELELSAQLEGSDWVTLERAAAETGVSRAALRTWYRTGQVPSRLVDGPHGPQRLVPLAVIAERAEASPRLRHSAERRLADEAQLEILRHRLDQLELRRPEGTQLEVLCHRLDQLELRLAALERRLPPART
jgi:transposase